MSIRITKFHHANVTVPANVEQAARNFYGSILGLNEIPKPESSRARGGAWYEIGQVQLHLSRAEGRDASESSRHVCLLAQDLDEARRHLVECGVEILPDERPIPGIARFYVRDPGGNLIEIAAE
jgi:catechol 2,3-dioxygenase-like lactoylglutathione lyase family enzyme